MLKNNFFLALIIGVSLFVGRAEGAPTGTSPKIPQPIETAPQQSSQIQPQPIDFVHCNKTFKLNDEKLFFLTLAAINANRFRIDEIQSKSAYILFSVGQRQFLASIVEINPQTSILKITPCDNLYYFPIGIVQNMFRYVELNINMPIEKLSIL